VNRCAWEDTQWVRFGNGPVVDVDELALYERALTVDEVRRHYVASGRELPPVPSELFGPNAALRNQELCRRCGDAGDPVDTFTGNLHMPVPAMVVPGRGSGLAVSVAYNSLAADTDSRVGYGWSSTLDMRIDTAPGGFTKTVVQETGATVSFDFDGATWRASARMVAALERDGMGTPSTLDDEWLFTRNHFERFRFDSVGRLKAISDQFANTTVLSYPGSSTEASAMTDPGGRSFTFGWAGGRLISVTGPAPSAGQPPLAAAFGYDGSGNLASYTDFTGGTWTFAYDDAEVDPADHLMVSMRKPRHQPSGPQLVNNFESSGRVEWQDDELGRRTQIAYDTPVAGQTLVTLPGGRQRLHTYVGGRREATTEGYGTPEAITTEFDFDPGTWATVAVRDGAGNETRFSDPDGDGNVDAVEDPTGRITRFAYNGFDQVTESRVGEIRTGPSSTNTSAVVTTLNEYDPGNGRLKKTTVAAGSVDVAVTDYVYGDASHREDVTRVIDARGKFWDAGYQAGTGFVVWSEDPYDNRTVVVPDALGRPLKVTSPEGVATPVGGDLETVFGYDLATRTTTVTDPTGVVAKTMLDANGNVVSEATGVGATSPAGDVTSYGYTAADELAVVDAPGPGSRSYTYWPSGERRSSVNESGATWTSSYDEVGRLKTEEDPNGRVTTYGYDAAGRLGTVRQPVPGASCTATVKVGCVTYGYDGAGRPMLVDYSDPATPDLHDFVYDALGRRTAVGVGADTEAWAWNRRSELTSHTDTNGRVTSYGWDRAGNLTQIGYPGQVNPLVRTFDDAGRLTKVIDWAGRQTSFGWDRDANHRSTLFPAAKNEDLFGYDQAGRMTQVTWKKGTTTLGAESYSRPASTKAMVDVATPSGAAGTTGRDHLYDTRDRLVGTGVEAFVYDPAGNLTETSDGRLQVFDPAQQLCWTSPTATAGTCATPAGDATVYGYDELGRRSTETTGGGNVTTYSYDQAHRLTTATVPDRGIATDGQYRPLVPGASRVADTTTGTGTCGGTPCARLAAGSTMVQVTGVGNVPATGAVAVAGTLSVVNPAGVGSVRVNPNGAAAAAEAFHGVGESVAVSFVAELDVNGRITLDAGTATDVRVDVAGLYTTPSLTAGSNFWPTDAHRLADTRTGSQTGTCNGGLCNRLSANQTVTIQATGVGPVPAGATAVVVSVIALDPGAVGVVRVAPNGDAAAGTLPLATGQPAYGVVTAPVDAQGRVTVTTTAGVDVLVDVAGWYVAPTGGDSGAALDLLDAPTQVVDTASGVGTCNAVVCAPLAAGTDHRLKVAGTAGVGGGALAAVINVGIIDPATSGFVAVGYNPTTGAMAGFGIATAGEDLYLSATVPVAEDGTISFTTTGTVDVTVDVVGVFVRPVDTWTYTYRSDGLRASKTETGSAPVEFGWDSSGGLPLLLTQHTSTGTSYVVYGPGDTPIYQVRQDGSVLNLHHDQLGSTRLVTLASNGNTYGTITYDAYGRITADTNPWFLERPLLGYTGQYHDTETGLIYLRARHYHPSTGQFLTRDPIVELTQEPYGYASANPANMTDPLGLFSIGDAWDATGGRAVSAVADVAETVREAAQDTGEFIVRNRGTIATAVALGGCFIPAVGWVGCAAASAVAFAVRTEQRFSDGSETAFRDSVIDGGFTYLTLGLGGAFSVFDDIGRVAYGSRFINGGYDAVGLAQWSRERSLLARETGC
jgi:RHS repeat-associated protein